MKDSVCLTKSEQAFSQTHSLKGHYDIHSDKHLTYMRNKVKITNTLLEVECILVWRICISS